MAQLRFRVTAQPYAITSHSVVQRFMSESGRAPSDFSFGKTPLIELPGKTMGIRFGPDWTAYGRGRAMGMRVIAADHDRADAADGMAAIGLKSNELMPQPMS